MIGGIFGSGGEVNPFDVPFKDASSFEIYSKVGLVI
jgi:hypothetical protein